MNRKRISSLTALAVIISTSISCLGTGSLPVMAAEESNNQAVVNSNTEAKDVYVKKTVSREDQKSVDVSKLSTPRKVNLVDNKATKETASLYSYLIGLGKTDKVIFGHQNDVTTKAVLKDRNTYSDTKDMTGSISGICGIDALALTGSELFLTDEDKANGVNDVITKAANAGIEASKEGAILTLSCHMPNFDEVMKKGKGVDGKYDYSGYTPGVTTGDVVSRIMPGGDLNEVFNGYLDMLAEYAHKLENEGIPVLFRPFHENNGSWFWWGAGFCSAEAYKNMYRYTVEYLRDDKSVHNFLYVYSPNGPFEDEKDYLSRYPGDEFIDILAFDMYHDDPLADSKEDPWFKSFKDTIELVQGIAESKNKLSAVSETGIRINYGAMPLTDNVNKDWFSDISEIVGKSDMPYYMVWANFDGDKNFFEPFMVDDKRGHEMVNNFVNYYNEDSSIFADGVGNYKEVDTSVDNPYSYGFITGPSGRSRILKSTELIASVKGYTDDIKFVIKNKNGKVAGTVNAALNNEVYTGQLTTDILNKVGKCMGTIELYSGDKCLDSITALFNIPEEVKNPLVVDDFESYYGEDSLLGMSWQTNAGPGCSLTPKNTESKFNPGKYGLEFNYKISTEKTSEGWAGITKAVDADWSSCNALSLWCKPDGNGQKLVIQLTSNGEDFEVTMPEFAAETEPKLLTIPFSDFKGKNGGIFDPAHIEKMGIWCNTIPVEGQENSWTVESKMYFDDIHAVNTKNDSNIVDKK